MAKFLENQFLVIYATELDGPSRNYADVSAINQSYDFQSAFCDIAKTAIGIKTLCSYFPVHLAQASPSKPPCVDRCSSVVVVTFLLSVEV